MSTDQRISDQLGIERLNADFRQCLDAGDTDGFCALFTEDALYSNGPRQAEGRDAIASFMAGRTAHGPRTTRHIYSGLKIDFDGDDKARGVSVWMSFAWNGEPPISMAEPFLVADMEDVYVKRDGRWLIAERRITPIFRNPKVPPPGAGAQGAQQQ